MSERLLDGHPLEIAAAPTSKGPPARREHDLVHPIGGHHPGGDVIGSETLMHRTMFTVDGDQVACGGFPHPPHHRPRGDQRLLVGEAQAFIGLEGRERDRESGKADHPVDHDVGGRCRARHRLRTDEKIDAARQAGREIRDLRLVGDRHRRRAELFRLRHEHIDGPIHAQRRDSVVLGLGTDDVERLGADGSRGPEHRYRRGHEYDATGTSAMGSGRVGFGSLSPVW